MAAAEAGKIDGTPPRRDQALAFIVARIAQTGTSPSFDEIGRELQVSSSRAKGLVAQLIERGVIEKTPGAQRNLRVVETIASRVSVEEMLRRLGWAVVTPAGIAGGFPNRQLPRLPDIEHLPDVD